MQPPTPRQLEILQYIRDFTRRSGCSPTMQEIGDHLYLSKVTVFEHVASLVKKDILFRGPKHTARSLRISPKFNFPDQRSTRLPLVGKIAAGLPMEAIEDIETLDLEEILERPNDTFVLQVTGQSMIDEHIREGDYVICERRNNPSNGETVVALLEDGEATLKKFYNEGGQIRLQPANENFEPIYVKNVDIQGVVVGMIRMF